MTRVLLDACMPHWLRRHLIGAVETSYFAGLDNLPDSALLDAIEGCFDVLVTLDRNLAYQQMITRRGLAVVVLRVPDQTPEAFRSLIPALNEAIANAVAGTVSIVGP